MPHWVSSHISTTKLPNNMSPKIPQNLPFICLSLLAFLVPCNSIVREKHNHKIKGMFVFGSSLVDNGNNNFIKNTIAKVDYLPYGIDFPFGPSGRFTNGKNVVDLLGEYLGIPSFIPPFTHPSTKGKKIVYGVNYASGGSGILDDTGALAGNVMSLNAQIRNFEKVTLPDLEVQLGSKSRESLPQFLFVVGSGGNDYSLNYFLGLVNPNVTLEQFTSNLTTTFAHQLERLYTLGARKFAIMAINPNGCSPMARARFPTRDRCVQRLNRAVHLFNMRLKTLVVDVTSQMPGSTLVFINTYKVIRDIIRDPVTKGFNNTITPCCEVATTDEGGNGILCKRGGSICTNRSSHVFFDGLHPTEAVNHVIATRAYASNSKVEVYPINVKRLSEI